MSGSPFSGSPFLPVTVDILIARPTVWGQQLGIVGDASHLGDGDVGLAPLLSYEPGGLWRGRFTLVAGGILRYRYFLRGDDGSCDLEWGPLRLLDLRPAPGLPAPAHVELRETWRSPGVLSSLFSGTMAQLAFQRPTRQAEGEPPEPLPAPSRSVVPTLGQRTVRVQLLLDEPRVPASHTLAVSGSASCLGAWDVSAAPRMLESHYPLFCLTLDVPLAELPLEYKFVLVSSDGPTTTGASQTTLSHFWEDGPNRVLEAPEFVRLESLSGEERAALSVQLRGLQRAVGEGAHASVAAALDPRAPPLGAPDALGTRDSLQDYSADTWVRRPEPHAVVAGEPFDAAAATGASSIAWHSARASEVGASGAFAGMAPSVPGDIGTAGLPSALDTAAPLDPAGTDEKDPGVSPSNARGPDAARSAALRACESLLLVHTFLARLEGSAAGVAGWRGASVCAPVFSLRSEHGLGVGEFSDVCQLVDWAASVGLRGVSLLPVNDTSASGGAEDSSPFTLTSAFALHPLYLSLDALLRPECYPPGYAVGTGADGAATLASRAPPGFAARVEAARAQLSGLPAAASGNAALGSGGDCGPSGGGSSAGRPLYPASVYGGSERDITRGQLDYAAVMRSKMALVRDLYRATGEAVLASPGFSRWFRGARDWLQPYALYCFFRDLQGTADTSAWGTRATLTRAQLHSLTDASQLHYRSIALHYYVQYLCHTQLAAAAAHAARAGVLLSVTLPHSMPRRSADVWAQPSLFRLGHVTGTPPDAADSAGSPSACVPYDWNAPPLPAEEGGMRGSGDSSGGGGSGSGGSGSSSSSDGGGAIEWWARRLEHMSSYFPAVRLASVGSFFRTYDLPAGSVTGLGGIFAPSQGFTAEELMAGLAMTPASTSGSPALHAPSLGAHASSPHASAHHTHTLSSGHGGPHAHSSGGGHALPTSDAPAPPSLARLTTPYIREWTARAALGRTYALVTERFFEIGDGGVYTFKQDLDSEAALATAAGRSSSGGQGVDSAGLYQLLHNVCFLVQDTPEGARYHPRSDMQRSTSFLELPETTRRGLARLHALYFTQRAPEAWRTSGRARLAAIASRVPRVVLQCDGEPPEGSSGSGSGGHADVIAALGMLAVRCHRTAGGGGAAGGGGDAACEVQFPYGCIAMPSTPDMPPLRSWWEEDASLSARFFARALGGVGPAPPTCTPDVAARMLRHYAASAAMWAEFLLQDLLAADGATRGQDAHAERIHVPAVQHVWKWRMVPSLEEIAGDAGAGLRREVAAGLSLGGRT